MPQRDIPTLSINYLVTGLVLALSFGTVLPEATRGADFKYAKKVIVPPTRIPRRYDYDSMGGRLSNPGYGATRESYYQGSTYEIPDLSTSGSPSVKGGKYDLVPPPPPVAPSLLPASMARQVAPPVSHSRASSISSQGRRISPHEERFGASSSQASGQLIAKAEHLASQGHLKDAQETLLKHQDSFKKDPAFQKAVEKVSLERAKYYLRRDNYREAAQQARIAMEFEPGSIGAPPLLNQALRHQGIDPLNSESRLAEARKLFTQGDYNQASVEYLQSIKLKPSAEAEIGLGNIAFREGKLKTAKARYQKALELAPSSSVAMRQLGITRYKLTDVVGANADLTRALVQDPADKLASQHLIELWQRQVSARPNDANSHLGLARAYQLSGDLKSAQNEYRTVVKIDPEHPNLPAARQSFKLALAREQAQSAYEAGMNLDSHGAVREAFDKASEAVRLSPGDSRYQIFQAQMLEKLGDPQGARSAYLQILSVDPSNTIAASRVQALNAISSPPTSTTGNTVLAINRATGASGAQPLGIPQYRGEGPALPYLPSPYNRTGAAATQIPTADPVQNMTGFLGSLRDLMLSQKKMLKADEEDVMVKLGLSKPSSSTTRDAASAAAGLPKLAEVDTTAPALNPDNLIKSEDVKKLLSSVNGSSASGLVEEKATAQSLASFNQDSLSSLAARAANAALTLKNNSNIDFTQIKNIAVHTAPTAPTAPNLIRTKNADEFPPLAPPIVRSPAITPVTSAPNQDLVGKLENQNKKLEDELARTKQELEQLKSGQPETKLSENENAEEEVEEVVEAEIEDPTKKTDPIAEAANNLRGAIPQSPQIASAVVPESVHLELLGVQAAKKDIRLKVRLRNEQASELVIPGSKKAVIRIAGSEDKMVPIKFPRKKLAAHSTMEGFIKIPGQRLSPAADVFIPELAGSGESRAHVHLTVPISSLKTASTQ
ncbi:tetratricopeptide repeat protein [bacterium]|nr:tetratricopeptide repeat protein [bacterium]